MDFSSGGKKVIERLVEAYGFTTRQALCDHLGVSKSTMATRYMRDIFPADWVLQCAMETGTPLEWLSFGRGDRVVSDQKEILSLPAKKIIDGEMKDLGFCIFDIKFLPADLINPVYVSAEPNKFICDLEFETVRDGMWIISIDGDTMVRSLTRLPGNRIHIDGGSTSFECALNDIEVIAKIVMNCVKQI